MRAIVTTYHGPTRTKPSKVKATLASGGASVELSWNHELDDGANHAAAVKALGRKLGWTGTLVGASSTSGSMLWVFTTGQKVTL